ncbi:MAG: tetratricopeptide repeat protein, partial [Alphaproteobacteria bacterium]
MVRFSFWPSPAAAFVALTLSLSPLTAAAADFDTGLEAYSSGDYARALATFQPLAEQGLAGAQTYLAHMLRDGTGIPASSAGAAKWYGRAAAQGDLAAQNQLGLMTLAGQGMPRDSAAAFRWFKAAARQGHA